MQIENLHDLYVPGVNPQPHHLLLLLLLQALPGPARGDQVPNGAEEPLRRRCALLLVMYAYASVFGDMCVPAACVHRTQCVGMVHVACRIVFSPAMYGHAQPHILWLHCFQLIAGKHVG
jgi:hypothetical protein